MYIQEVWYEAGLVGFIAVHASVLSLSFSSCASSVQRLRWRCCFSPLSKEVTS